MSGGELQRTLSALRRFRASSRVEPEPARCELCAAPLAESHAHLFELEARALECACTACSYLFPASGDQRRRRVEPRVDPLPDLQLNDDDWHALDVPVRLVFLSPSALHDCLYAIYPNAQGAVQSQLPLRAWHELLRAHPLLASTAYELEALVLDGRAGRCAAVRVSIDVCHGLVGMLRSHARSFGGTAPALRGGASSSTAPALRGGASFGAGWPQLERALADLQRGVHA